MEGHSDKIAAVPEAFQPAEEPGLLSMKRCRLANANSVFTQQPADSRDVVACSPLLVFWSMHPTLAPWSVSLNGSGFVPGGPLSDICSSPPAVPSVRCLDSACRPRLQSGEWVGASMEDLEILWC